MYLSFDCANKSLAWSLIDCGKKIEEVRIHKYEGVCLFDSLVALTPASTRAALLHKYLSTTFANLDPKVIVLIERQHIGEPREVQSQITYHFALTNPVFIVLPTHKHELSDEYFPFTYKRAKNWAQNKKRMTEWVKILCEEIHAEVPTGKFKADISDSIAQAIAYHLTNA